MSTLFTQLEVLGLSSTEAKVYMAVLENTKSGVAAIARQSGVKRTTIYQYIEDLLAKGLIIQSVKGKRTVYVAENPERLMKEVEKKRKTAEDVIPELSALYKMSRHEPKVSFYEGKKGQSEAYEIIFNTHQTIYSTFSLDHFVNVFSWEQIYEDYIEIKKQGVRVRLLVEHSKNTKRFRRISKEHGFSEVKSLPEDFSLSTDVIVTGDTVLIGSISERFSVIIENSEIAEYHRNIHQLLWKIL